MALTLSGIRLSTKHTPPLRPYNLQTTPPHCGFLEGTDSHALCMALNMLRNPVYTRLILPLSNLSKKLQDVKVSQ